MTDDAEFTAALRTFLASHPVPPAAVAPDPVKLSGWLLGGPAGFDPNDNPNIYQRRPDGTAKIYLTTGTSIKRDPSWSFDGKRIAFAGAGQMGMQLCTMAADGTDLKTLPVAGLVPSFTPDGKFLVFQMMMNPSEVGIVDVEGKLLPVRLTHTTVGGKSRGGASFIGSGAASVSPDGKKILYTSSQPGSNQLHTMNIDGTNQKQLTFPTDPLAPHANAGKWSPDGTKIVFYGGFELEVGDVYLMNADGTGRTKLTNCVDVAPPARRATADAPSWSPDGLNVIFGSSMGLDGKGLIDPNVTIRTWIIGKNGTGMRVLCPVLNCGARGWTL